MPTQIQEPEIANHPAVNIDDWKAASAKLLVKEKEFTRMRDDIARQRRELPWTKVKEDYTFHGPNGDVKLSELFDGKSQLIIYHAMWGPNDDEPCPGCSFVMDHIDAARQHFEHHDIAFAAVSRAPFGHFADFKKRMGWQFRWLSSDGTNIQFRLRRFIPTRGSRQGGRLLQLQDAKVEKRRAARTDCILQE